MGPRPPPPTFSLQYLLTTTDLSTIVTTIALVVVLVYVLLTNLPQSVRVWGIFSNSIGVEAGNGVQYGDEDGGNYEREDGICGLWNQGNTCYQNSVLQAMASLTSWRRHLDAVAYTQDEDGEPRPVVLSLKGILGALNRYGKPLYVPGLLSGGTERGGWIYNEQQDAQEFFQKVTAGVEREVAKLWEGLRAGIRGLGLGEAVGGLSIGGDAADDSKEGEKSSEGGKEKVREKKASSDPAERIRCWIKPEELENPFQGWAAQRVGCLKCGYVEEIRLQSFTSLPLSLPSDYECTLEECLAEYTLIEHIPQVDCDKCTLLYHRSRLLNLLENLPSPSSPTSFFLKETLSNRLEIVNQAISEDDFSPEVFEKLALPKGQRVGVTKTKQTMIARPPKVLVCHLNRSQFDIHSGVVRKNFAGVKVPLWLDIGAVPGVVVRGEEWGVDPAKPISGNGMEGEGVESGGGLYELKGLVAHYGGHHNGHYICYRKTGKRWWKISDHQVYRVMAAEVEGVMNGFMAFYERVVDEEALGGWRRRREKEKELAREVARMKRVLVAGRKEGELGLEVPRAGGVGILGKAVGVGVGAGVGGLGLGLSLGKGKFGSDSDVDAVLMGLGVGTLMGEARKEEGGELDVGVGVGEVKEEAEAVKEEKNSEGLPLDSDSALPAAGPLTPVEAVSVITTDTEKHDQTPQMIENKTEKEKETQKEKAQLPSPLEGGEERVKFDIRVNTTANGAVIAVMNVVGKEEDTKARPPTPPAAQTSRSPTPPGIKRAKKGQGGVVVNGSAPVDVGKEEGGKVVLVN
ncbi:hypothetical protein BGX38DRAFT_330118 [Terfezia claveryi]|nr:hypothetical protein BGX38DRAFT_330118 [Terfezia claveryi]